MKEIKIFTAAAGQNYKSSAGWSFVVAEEFPITGSTVTQYGGCSHATVFEASSLAILEACYWCRDNRIANATIYALHPQKAIGTFRFDNLFPYVVQQFERNTASDYFKKVEAVAENMAVQAYYDFTYEQAVGWHQISAGDTLYQKEPIYSKRMLVLAVFVNRVVCLKNLSSRAKQPLRLSAEEFDKGNFIFMR